MGNVNFERDFFACLYMYIVYSNEWTLKLTLYGPRQANLCLRAFRHNKFQLRMPSHSEGLGIWLSV